MRSVRRLADGGRLRRTRIIKIELIVPIKWLIVATSVITVPEIVVIIIYKHTTQALLEAKLLSRSYGGGCTLSPRHSETTSCLLASECIVSYRINNWASRSENESIQRPLQLLVTSRVTMKGGLIDSCLTSHSHLAVSGLFHTISQSQIQASLSSRG